MPVNKAIDSIIAKFDANNVSMLAQRLKDDDDLSREAVTKFSAVFKSEKVQKQYYSLLMLEILSKHGSLQFHQYLAEDKFIIQFAKCFKLCRGKKGIFTRFESNKTREMRQNVEHHALYLLQLWADTFMMHQETYPGFQKLYRQLKVEGVKFPDRDTNERTMMDNLDGIDSPMFEFMEQMTNKASHKENNNDTEDDDEREDENKDTTDDDINGGITKGTESSSPPMQLQKAEPKTMNKAPKSYKMNKQDYLDISQSLIDEIEDGDYEMYETELCDTSELDIGKNHVDLLDDMSLNCSNLEDMCKDVIINLYITAVKSKIRIEKIIEVRRAHEVEDDHESSVLEAARYINSKIDDFKIKFEKMKKKSNRKQKRKERKQKKQQKQQNQNQKAASEANPFEALEQTETDFKERPNKIVSSDESEEYSDDNDSSCSDSDGLHRGIDIQEQQKRDSKAKKSDKSRASDGNNNEKKGFFRNSVLVKTAVNFFSRGSRKSSLISGEIKHDILNNNEGMCHHILHTLVLMFRLT